MSSAPMATGAEDFEPGLTLPRATALSTAFLSSRVVYSSTMSYHVMRRIAVCMTNALPDGPQRSLLRAVHALNTLTRPPQPSPTHFHEVYSLRKRMEIISKPVHHYLHCERGYRLGVCLRGCMRLHWSPS